MIYRPQNNVKCSLLRLSFYILSEKCSKLLWRSLVNFIQPTKKEKNYCTVNSLNNSFHESYFLSMGGNPLLIYPSGQMKLSGHFWRLDSSANHVFFFPFFLFYSLQQCRTVKVWLDIFISTFVQFYFNKQLSKQDECCGVNFGLFLYNNATRTVKTRAFVRQVEKKKKKILGENLLYRKKVRKLKICVCVHKRFRLR